VTINIDIISGFLGAGKTTFLKKIIPNMEGKIALIENEFGHIGVDGDLINDELPIREIYSGCICCSLVQDFKKAIEELLAQYRLDHILIEPSGVGNLSDIAKVCEKISKNADFDIRLNHLITIVDVSAFEDYSDNFGTFYLNQIQNANIIFLSHFDELVNEEIENVISRIRSLNPEAYIFKEEWFSIQGEKLVDILNTIKNHEIDINEKTESVSESVAELASVTVPANKIFSTFSVADPIVFTEEKLEKLLDSLISTEYGFVLRAKGMLQLDTYQFVYFDFTPQHHHFEYIEECKETKAVFIGCDLKKKELLEWFHE